MFASTARIISPRRIKVMRITNYTVGIKLLFKRIRGRKIILNLQYAYNFGFRLPRSFIARIYKRRFVLYGEKLKLLMFIKELVEMRKPNIYTGKGLRLRRLPYRVKPGKVRRR